MLHLSTRPTQTRILLALLFILSFVLILSLLPGCKAPSAGQAIPPSLQHLPPETWMGVHPVSPATLQRILPESRARAVLLEFGSSLCLDCQQLKKTLLPLLVRHPAVVYQDINIQAKQPSAMEQALINAFKPVTVPVLVFVKPRGQIGQVLYNNQPAGVLNQALEQLEHSRP